MISAAPVDVGRAGEGPAALIVVTPGMPVGAYGRLVRTLEQHGLDAWMLSFPPEAQDPTAMVDAEIPGALAAVRGARGGARKVALVGHGLGGRLAAASVASGHARPDALALLGAPLDLASLGEEPEALIGWLAALPVLTGDLDLSTLTLDSWKGMPVLPLLLGDPPPTLGVVSGAWLASLAAEVGPGHAISLATAPCPVWEGASPSDNLAPPETVRASLGGGTFVRFGYLHLDPREPDHMGLLSDPIPVDALVAWTAHALNKNSRQRSAISDQR